MSSAQNSENSIDNYKKSNGGKNTNSINIALQSSSNRSTGTSFFEIEESQPCQSSSLPRVASGRVTRPESQLMVDSYPTYFSGMDSSGVIAPRSWSRPCIDVLTRPTTKLGELYRILDSNRCGVANIDRDDIFPTNNNFIQWVNNRNSFIKNNYFRPNKYQPRDKSDHSCPECSSNSALKGKINKTLNSVDPNRNQYNAGKDEAASRTETLGIAHNIIISRNEQP